MGLQEGKSQSAIASQIGVAASTVSREIRRNKAKTGRYNWHKADNYAAERKERLRGNKALKTDIKKKALKFLVEEDWSVCQISGYLAREGIKISHVTIR